MTDTNAPRGKTIQKKCATCGDTMTVRLADHERGWGKFCSKSCKAKKQGPRMYDHQRGVTAKRARADQEEFGGLPQYNNQGEYIGFRIQGSFEDDY